MGSGKVRAAIFGGGRVGTAMAAEMPGVPIVRRGEDIDCAVACVCWPAQAVRDFAEMHPRGALGCRVAFCNGAWAVADGVDHAGVCYVRAVNRGDRAAAGRKGWRVGRPDVAAVLRAAGLGVVCSRGDHEGHVWGKALYVLPLALACADTGLDARAVADTSEYAAWYDAVAAAARRAGVVVAAHEARVRYLCERSPRGWRPSSSAEELEYFRGRLCAD